MSKIRSCLSRFVAHYQCLRIDQPESINDDFAFDRLYGVDNHSDRTRSELFERLLRVDVDRG